MGRLPGQQEKCDGQRQSEREDVSRHPLAADVQTDANNAQKLTFNTTANIKGILDLGPLNKILTAAGDATVSAGSLG